MVERIKAWLKRAFAFRRAVKSCHVVTREEFLTAYGQRRALIGSYADPLSSAYVETAIVMRIRYGDKVLPTAAKEIEWRLSMHELKRKAQR
jgi:hypothetical protein